jgi:hypothetical protein
VTHNNNAGGRGHEAARLRSDACGRGGVRPGRARALPRTPGIAIVVAGAAANVGEGGSVIWRPFFRELRKLGYVEGRNIEIARGAAEGRHENEPEIVQEAIRSKPDVAVANTPPGIPTGGSDQDASYRPDDARSGRERIGAQAWRGPARTSPASRSTRGRSFTANTSRRSAPSCRISRDWRGSCRSPTIQRRHAS